MFVKKSVEDVKERIQVLRLRIIDVKNLEEKTIHEISIVMLYKPDIYI